MEYLNSHINREEQLKKIIEDTEEIIKNFMEISEIFAERLNKRDDSMYQLGKRLVNQHKSFDNSNILGANQVEFIL